MLSFFKKSTTESSVARPTKKDQFSADLGRLAESNPQAVIYEGSTAIPLRDLFDSHGHFKPQYDGWLEQQVGLAEEVDRMVRGRKR